VRVALLVLLVIGALPGTLEAQRATPLSGTRVRIVRIGDSETHIGSLVRLSPDTVTFQPGLGNVAVAFPLDSVRTIEESHGMHADAGRIIRDAGIGAGIGLVAAFPVVKAMCHGQQEDSWGCAYAYLGGGLAVVTGLVVGALVGGNHPAEHWNRVYPPKESTSLLVAPGPRGGVSIGLAVAFGGSSRLQPN
jgi:hypothetical protein